MLELLCHFWPPFCDEEGRQHENSGVPDLVCRPQVPFTLLICGLLEQELDDTIVRRLIDGQVSSCQNDGEFDSLMTR